MPKLEIRFSSVPGRIPTVDELDGYKFGWNISDGIAYGLIRVDGIRYVVPIGSGGLNGLTPFIGTNGNWWIGEEDTGVMAEGVPGDSAYVYIAYASDTSGTDFTLTFNAALDYIAILANDTEIPAPAASDFAGLWKKYKGEPGADGSDGVGVPAGGTFGQVLTKSSEDDFDTSWQTPSGGGDSYEYWRLKGSSVEEVKFGLLYNWYALTDVRNICAEGWEVPTINDWKVLMDYAGASGNYTNNGVGIKFKEMGFDYWNSPNNGSTNEYGFNARGASIRNANGLFETTTGLKYFTSFAARDYEFYITGYYYVAAGLRFNNNGFHLYYAGYGEDVIPGEHYPIGRSVRLIKTTTNLTHGQTGIYTGNDGKVYRTICIGTQEWLADNLAETKFRNGDTIPEVTDNAAWTALTTGALCAYNNDWDNVLGESEGNYNVNSHDLVSFKNSGSVEFSVTENEDGEKEITAEAIGGGAATFLDLTDTPSTYAGQAGKVPQVNSGETGLEWGSGLTSADKYYRHEQNIPSAVWSINHGLLKYPSVSILDTGGNTVEANINHIDNQNLILTFSAPFSGFVDLN